MTGYQSKKAAAQVKLEGEKHMKQVKLFVGVDDYEVGLVFTWDESESAWICKMDDDFMQELGALPFNEEQNT